MRALIGLRGRVRTLVAELVLVAGLAVVAVVVPRESGPVTGWDMMVAFFAFCAHALIGVVVLADATVTLLRAPRGPVRALRSWLGVGLAGVVLAVLGGAAWLAGTPIGAVGVVMAGGWLIAMMAYAAVWRAASAAIAAHAHPRHAARPVSDRAGRGQSRPPPR